MIATQKSVRKKVLNSLSSVLIIFIVIASVFAVLNFIPVAHADIVIKQISEYACQYTGPSSCTVTVSSYLQAGDIIVLTVATMITTNNPSTGNPPSPPWVTSITQTVQNPITLLKDNPSLGYQSGSTQYSFETQIWEIQVTSAYSSNNYAITAQTNGGSNNLQWIQLLAFVIRGIDPNVTQSNIAIASFGQCQTCTTDTSVTLPQSSYLAVMVTARQSPSSFTAGQGFTLASRTNPSNGFVEYSLGGINGTSTNFPFTLNSAYYGNSIGILFNVIPPATTTITQTITSTITQTVTTTLTLSTAYTLITSTVTVTSTNFINQLISYPNISTFQFWFWPLFMWLLFAGLFVALGRMANADSKAFIILVMLGLTFGSIVGTLMGVTPVIFIPIFAMLLVLTLWKLH